MKFGLQQHRWINEWMWDLPGCQTNRFLYNNWITNKGIRFVGILTVPLAHSRRRFTISKSYTFTNIAHNSLNVHIHSIKYRHLTQSIEDWPYKKQRIITLWSNESSIQRYRLESCSDKGKVRQSELWIVHWMVFGKP